MIEGLPEKYLKAGNRNGILVIPVGLAFDEINRNYPSIDYTLLIKDILLGRELI
ncbi:MAG: hypothetical protein Ct9H90mP4_03880 [Gammaproteobacteria bacterium]|nr:MAG: hypothetical protein Ct9H90mP4_03880 [Gammaproteobacteria bacterium]